jgi:hypothetical protein
LLSSPIADGKVFDAPAHSVPDPTQAQPREANDPENAPRLLSSPIATVNVFDEPAHHEEMEKVQPRVPKHEHGPVATTVKPAATQPAKPKKPMGDISTGIQTVVTKPSAPEGDMEAVVPVVRPLPAELNMPRNKSSRANTAGPVATDEGVITSAVDVREPNQPALSLRLQNTSGELSMPEQLSEQRAGKKSTTTVARPDNADQAGQSKALVVPRIVIEKISADRDEQPPRSAPASVRPTAGMPLRLSTTDLSAASRVRPSADLHKEPSQTKAIEPVINVTIGRVEVRAIAASNAPRKDRNSGSSSKLMSLDDYLHQRAQGDRR